MRPLFYFNTLFFSENIFGYRNLKVDMYMTASTLKAFIRMKSDEVISMKMSGDVKPDPVIPPLLEILAPDQVISFVAFQ